MLPPPTNTAGALQGGDRVGVVVDAVEGVTRVEAARLHQRDVAVVVGQGVGEEEQAIDGAEERTHLLSEEGDALRGAEPAGAE